MALSVASLALFLGIALEQAEAATQRKARELFDAGCASFEKNWPETAVLSFQDLLRDFPRSPLAPEAAYRLAAAHLLQGNVGMAGHFHGVLIRDYFASPWAQLALHYHFTEEQILRVADELRQRGREARPELARAGKLYQLCLDRAREKNKTEM